VMVANIEDPGALTNLIAGALRLNTRRAAAARGARRPRIKRLRNAVGGLGTRARLVAVGSKIQSQVQSSSTRAPRVLLRQQLKAIQDELGEADEVRPR